MKQYIYLAESKINSLYKQVTSADEIEQSEEFSAGFSPISGKMTQKAKGSISVEQKLDTVIKNLERQDAISYITDMQEGEYIEGTLCMAWNNYHRITSGLDATFWIGIDKPKADAPYSETRILLFGSAYNILGNICDKSYFSSASYIDAFFKNIHKNIDYENLQSNMRIHDISIDSQQQILRVMEKDTNLTPERADYIKRHVLPQNSMALYIDELWENYVGSYCEYNFTARVLSMFLDFREDQSIIRYIVATPLYVAYANQPLNRCIVLNDTVKYVITKLEYLSHRKNNYRNICLLLQNENLNSLEENFTSEMKILFEKFGRHTLFLSKKKQEEFLKEADKIVDKYFYIAQ